MKVKFKYLILFIAVFACSINPFYAAIISDNDGSAFVTKAEFEALKNNFSSQINEYNTSIDTKIDGAISSYLAGIRLQTVSKEKMIHYDWSNIEFLNYEIKPEFKVPSYRWWITAGWISDGSYNGGSAAATDLKTANVCGFKKFDRVWGANETCIRPKATLLHGSESSIGKVAWDGCAARWDEKWIINKIAWGTTNNMIGADYYRVKLHYPLSFLVTGNIKGKTIKQLITARMDFEASSNNSTWYTATLNSSNVGQIMPYTYENGTYVFSADLGELSDGTKTLHDHIFVENGNNTQLWLSNNSFTNTINNCNYQTLEDSDIGSVSGVTTKVTGARCTYISTRRYITDYVGNIIWEYQNVKMPLVGLLPTHYYAKDIYQEKYNVDSSNNVLDRTITWNGKTLNNAPPLKLNNGLEVCISEVEKEYEWDIEFEEVILSNSSGSRKNQNEVDVYLSTVPFGDGVTTTAPVKVKVNGVEKDYFTTTDRKGSFKWEVDNTKIVYMKCIPHYKSTDSGTENYYIKLKDTAKFISVIS